MSKIVPLWLKNRNQRVDTGGGVYTRGAYTWTNTSVKEKVHLSAEGPIHGGGGRRNTVSESNKDSKFECRSVNAFRHNRTQWAAVKQAYC